MEKFGVFDVENYRLPRSRLEGQGRHSGRPLTLHSFRVLGTRLKSLFSLVAARYFSCDYN